MSMSMSAQLWAADFDVVCVEDQRVEVQILQKSKSKRETE